MHKKTLVIVSVLFFVLVLFSNTVFANNELKQSVSNVTNKIIDGTEKLGSDVRTGIGNAENGIENFLNMNNNNTDTNNNGANDSFVNNYVTTPTDTTGFTQDTFNSNLWIWLIIAVASIVIIGLVWYYGTENNNTHRD